MIELPFKDVISSALSNPILSSLIRDKIYQPNPNTEIRLDGDLNFSIGMSDDKIVITCHDLKPKISYSPFSGMKRLMKVDGRLSTITISSSKIILGIDGLPDQTITLT